MVQTQKENPARRDPNFRLAKLRENLCEGATWEPSTSDILDRLRASSSQPKRPANRLKMKPLSAKHVKTLERQEANSDLLTGEDATLYRALAARTILPWTGPI